MFRVIVLWDIVVNLLYHNYLKLKASSYSIKYSS